ncbi:hypothetical protein CQY22_017065 [Mycolicibacterium brumae]|uniref:Uncharacterized protein n=1 Tax=Mycolicibacterium brumae TaxID=85968 RepID=A0A2G5P5G9_9MYCO|nr:hypothetical protein CQY22_017065 [Mycolicibacterium brumae]RWA18108.1 hypothetical protein MBRU_17935 [Mycolicibacterium brumae DSM 44177]
MKWPTDTGVTPDAAVEAVWKRIQELPSMKMACGYVGRELNVSPTLLYAWVLKDQGDARERSPAIAEPYTTTIAEISSLPDGAVVRVSGRVVGVQRRSTTRGMPWVKFGLWQQDRFVEVTAFGETYEQGGHLVAEDAVVTVEGRKWFHEETTIAAVTVTRTTGTDTLGG